MPSNLSTVEVKLRSRKVLGLSAETPVNLMHQGKVISDDGAPMRHINYGMTEKDIVHLYVDAHLLGGMMQGLCSTICGEEQE